MPRLKAIYEETKDTQILNVLTGKLGLRTVLLDEIIKGKVIYSFQLTQPRDEYKNEYEANAKRREKLGIPIRILTPFFGDDYPLSESRQTDLRGKISLYAYANKTSLVYDSEELKILTIKIPEIAEFFKELFEKEWS